MWQSSVGKKWKENVIDFPGRHRTEKHCGHHGRKEGQSIPLPSLSLSLDHVICPFYPFLAPSLRGGQPLSICRLMAMNVLSVTLGIWLKLVLDSSNQGTLHYRNVTIVPASYSGIQLPLTGYPSPTLLREQQIPILH